jgi:dUTP pyrophosphatase
MVEVKVIKLPHYDSSFELPFYATEGAAGADIRASLLEKKSLTVKPGERVLVPTGLSMEIPVGFEVQVRPRSGLSLKSPLMIVNSPGTVDCDYRGEVNIIIGNFGKEDYVIEHGLRIAQLVIAPVTQAKFLTADSLSETQRGSGGFGSTGTR